MKVQCEFDGFRCNYIKPFKPYEVKAAIMENTYYIIDEDGDEILISLSDKIPCTHTKGYWRYCD